MKGHRYFNLFVLLLLTMVISSPIYGTGYSQTIWDLAKVEVLIGDEKFSAYTYFYNSNYFIEAELGERYTIRVHNKHDQRIAVVVSVDGRDVITGRKAKPKFGHAYVIDPFNYIDIHGFRKSMSNVATFRFSSPSRSYSMKMATPEEKAAAYAKLGAIGIAIFPEKEYYITYKKDRRYKKRDYDLGLPSPQQNRSESEREEARKKTSYSSKLGTEYGETRYDGVTVTNFKPKSKYPQQVFILYYNTREGLHHWGVPVRYYLGGSKLPEYPFAPPPPKY